MRTAEDMRGRCLEMLPQLLARTSMYAPTGRELVILVNWLLDDLCAVDERDDDAAAVNSELLDRYGSLGVTGPFEAMFDAMACQAEVASIYAEVFARLGYLTVDEEDLVSPERWDEISAGLRATFDGCDLRRSEAEQALGLPSLVVDRRVLCYTSARSADGWLFVDCPPQQVRSYRPDQGSFQVAPDPDPLVRSLRRSGGEFEAGLILTRYGKVLRWGPGWWTDHHNR